VNRDRSSTWVLRSFVPANAVAALVGAAAGVFRAEVAFVPGVQGMLLLGVLGYCAGRLGRGDPERFWTFGQRVCLALAAAASFGAGEIAGLSEVLAGPYDGTLDWLWSLLRGTAVETAAAIGTIGRVPRGRVLALHGVWWVGFTALDLLLGAFVFVATTVPGVGPRRQGPPAEGDAGHGPSSAPSRAGLAALAGLLVGLLAAAGSVVLAGRASRERDVLSLDNLQRNRRLVGEWQVAADGGQATVPPGQDVLTVAVAGMDDVVAIGAGRACLIRLWPLRRARRFEGRLEPGAGFAWFRLPPSFDRTGSLRVAGEVSDDGHTLRFVVERGPGDQLPFVARRAGMVEPDDAVALSERGPLQ